MYSNTTINWDCHEVKLDWFHLKQKSYLSGVFFLVKFSKERKDQKKILWDINFWCDIWWKFKPSNKTSSWLLHNYNNCSRKLMFAYQKNKEKHDINVLYKKLIQFFFKRKQLIFILITCTVLRITNAVLINFYCC